MPTTPASNWCLSLVAMLLVLEGGIVIFYPIHCIAPQPVEDGDWGTHGTPKVVPLARLTRGGEKGRKGGRAMILGEVEHRPVRVEF
jgi:hypothetical protein